MKTIRAFFLQRFFREEQGQTLVFVTFGLIGLLGMGGMTIDVGHAYLVHEALQANANAAALAAVPYLYSTVNTVSTPSTVLKNAALLYSGAASSDYNYKPTMGTITPTVATPCYDVLLSNTTCSKSGNNSNAVVVNLTSQVPTTLMRLFGVKMLNVGATATGSPGSITQPWNLAIILDGTNSMNTTDSNCSSMTEEQCALNGISQMLTKINPCGASGTNCTAASNQALVRVSLFTFPNVDTGSVANDITCGGKATEDLYTLPRIPTTGYTLTGTPLLTSGYVPIKYTPPAGTAYTATYQVTYPSASPSTTDPDVNGFSSDFFPGSGGKVLNPNSNLVKAVGNVTTDGKTTTTGCLQPPTQMDSMCCHSFFTGAIYAAQAALQAEKPLADKALTLGYPTYGLTSTNAIIFISDGQAQVNTNTSYKRFPAAGSTASTAGSAGVGGYNVAYNSGSYTDPSTKHNFLSTTAAQPLSTWGIYPDYNDLCQQAMTAAQFAAAQGTRVFGVAYGAETNGCLLGDSPYPGNDDNSPTAPLVVNYTSANATGYPATAYPMNVAISSYTGLYPCVTMENIADTYVSPTGVGDFYSEISSNLMTGCSTKVPNAQVTSLSSIFQAIVSSLGSGPRLVPNQ